ncbi:MAG: hypothetical protein ACI4XP_04195 [Acutalibacteraceae bacterium]
MSENIEIIKQFYAQYKAYAFNGFYIMIISYFDGYCKKNNCCLLRNLTDITLKYN